MASNSLPLISAVMPSYNNGSYIKEALDSIIGQNYPNLEIIVMDGGSTDDTIEILKSYGEKINWVSGEDINQSDAINKGIKKARGEIIAWLNSDDVYFDNIFSTVVKHFMENPESKWMFGKCININQNGKEIRKFITAYKNLFLPHYSYTSLLIQNYLSQMAIFFKREIYLEVGGLDIELNSAMDYDLWLRIGKKYEPTFINQRFGKYRLHTGSKTIYNQKGHFNKDYECCKKYAGNRLWIIALHKLFHITGPILYSFLSFIEGLNSKKNPPKT